MKSYHLRLYLYISSVDSRDIAYKDLALRLIKSKNCHFNNAEPCIKIIKTKEQKEIAFHCIALTLFPKIVIHCDERYLVVIINLVKEIPTIKSQEGLIRSLTRRYPQTLEISKKSAEWLRFIKKYFSPQCFNEVEKFINKHN
ncbi:hypothetical protein CL657_01135 [bacterium]|nr:hypothetical protein [bacterium]|tara:strand:+ start:325 stop:750 length:426 start_codon:yes stop_codon:yes gene_type:complete